MKTLTSIFTILFLTLILFACKNDDTISDTSIFSEYLKTKKSIAEEVIACAASSKNKEQILVYFFPETNTSSYKLYLLTNLEHPKTDFKHYALQAQTSKITVANTLRSFQVDAITSETWAIVSFEKNNEIHYSNPINLKHQKSPTIYHSNITITIDTDKLHFTWPNMPGNDTTENAIFFEIVTTENNQLISGTYTTENNYTYLDNSNVVLTITPNNTQKLNSNTNYGFAVMGVSEDNWVNFIAEKDFTTTN